MRPFSARLPLLYRSMTAATSSSRVAMLTRRIATSPTPSGSGAFQMRQRLNIREHFWRGNATIGRRATMPSEAKRSTTAAKSGPAQTASAGTGASGKKVNPALMKPLQPSNELAAVVGSEPLPRPEVVSKVWDYIKKNNLQDPANKREIRADEQLQAVFGKNRVTMFEMNKHLAQHLT